MAAYYQIDHDKITIRPLAFLAPIGIAVLALLLLFPIVAMLILANGHLQEIEAKHFATYLLELPLLLGCIAFFTYSRRQVVFDAVEKSISLKTVWGQKKLMAFNQVANIQPVTRVGLAYYLHSTEDRYGKGYRISPSFANEKEKGRLEFDQKVLPAIYNLLEAKTAVAPAETMDTKKVLFEAGQLAYYQTRPEGYLLTPMKSKRYMIPLIVFCAFAVYMWYQYLTKPMPTADDKQIPIFLLIPVIMFVVTVTKRLVFDVDAQAIKLYRMGILTTTYPINTFAGFNIVRKTYNGMYNGTDVRLKFNKPGSTQQRELTLADFGKTNPIEGFIDETEFVIKRLQKA